MRESDHHGVVIDHFHLLKVGERVSAGQSSASSGTPSRSGSIASAIGESVARPPSSAHREAHRLVRFRPKLTFHQVRTYMPRAVELAGCQGFERGRTEIMKGSRIVSCGAADRLIAAGETR